MVPTKELEPFRGVVENTIAGSSIGWIRTETNEVLFFHANYTRTGKLPAVGAAVKGNISRVKDPARQDRAMNVEVIGGK